MSDTLTKPPFTLLVYGPEVWREPMRRTVADLTFTTNAEAVEWAERHRVNEGWFVTVDGYGHELTRVNGASWGTQEQPGEITNDALLDHLLGRTIVAWERDPPTDEEWPQGARAFSMTLDDGTTWAFDGWGYDSSGLSITAVPAAGSDGEDRPDE